MKFITTFLALFLTISLFSQTFCLQLRETSNVGNIYTVAIDVQGSSTFNLGSSNFQWSYDTDSLSTPEFVSSPLQPPFYNIPTVTTPLPGEVSFNVELGFPGFGTEIAAEPAWAEIGQVQFTMADPPNVGTMVWSYTGGTTETIVFLDDEATQIFVTDPGGGCLDGLGPLPVRLMSFEAMKKEGAIDLFWITTFEENNLGYEVQKRNQRGEWEKLGWVDGVGNSVLQQEYQLRDLEPFKGDNYYRLKQIDFDGKFEYSNVVHINFKKAGKNITISPNPASLTITIQIEKDNLPPFQIYDAIGRLVFQSSENRTSIQEIDVSTWQNGWYNLRVINSNESIKFLVQD